MRYLRLLIHIPPLLLLGCFVAFILWLNTGETWLFWEGANGVIRDLLRPLSAPLRFFGFAEGENGEFLSVVGRFIAILLYVLAYYLAVWGLLRLTIDRKRN